MPVVSILVPIYNVENYLHKCLDSILNQTFLDFEVICVNDGSTDQSRVILDRYATQDRRIIVVHKENEGYGKTMNRALMMAKGNYVGVVEPDDVILPQMYEKYVQDMEAYGLDLVKSDFFMTWHHDDGTVLNDYFDLSSQIGYYDRVLCPHKDREAFFFEKYTWNGLYRRSFLEEYGIRYQETPGASYQDNGFWFQTMYWAKRVMFRREAYYCYTRDNENASSFSKGKVYAFRDEYDYIRRLLTDYEEEDPFYYRICFHHRLRGYLITLNRIAPSYRREFAEAIREECSLYEKKGEAEYKWLPKNEEKTIRNICDDPRGYVERMNDRDRFIENVADGVEHIVIYGAGAKGSDALMKLRSILTESQTADVAVTSFREDNHYCLNVKTRELKEFLTEKETVRILLAVKPGTENYKEMKSILNEYGFRDVVEYDPK